MFHIRFERSAIDTPAWESRSSPKEESEKRDRQYTVHRVAWAANIWEIPTAKDIEKVSPLLSNFGTSIIYNIQKPALHPLFHQQFRRFTKRSPYQKFRIIKSPRFSPNFWAENEEMSDRDKDWGWKEIFLGSNE
jgi:hypothetical protein